ncbi:hypothetical protein IAQ61_000751 [Plenodomus lingam]|uniref:uncharacterized protein n=1 Tax=Leptosphaeria maculans TaxID=5022 RepID=UPI00332D2CDC|nr:hypothetical protein IAQ61_000751 [Plenodomus lingam]
MPLLSCEEDEAGSRQGEICPERRWLGMFLPVPRMQEGPTESWSDSLTESREERKRERERESAAEKGSLGAAAAAAAAAVATATTADLPKGSDKQDEVKK